MKNQFVQYLFVFVLISTAFSCTVVKRFKPNEPFIFENKVKLKGVTENEKKGDIRRKLEDQIEDSALVNSVSKIPWPKFPWVIPVPVISRPVRYDSNAIKQSIVNMKNLMFSLGYKSSVIVVDTTLVQRKKQSRIKVNYDVEAGRLFRIDNVVLSIADTSLQQLANTFQSASLLKKGRAFEYETIDLELNRIVDSFHNHGYFKFNRDDIIAEADSSYNELIDPSLDPFEYVQRLAEVEEKRRNPQVDIYIRLNAIRDSTHLKIYSIGEFIAYSDHGTNQIPDSSGGSEKIYDGIKVVSYNNTFNSAFIADQIDLKPGDLYTRDKYSQTLNNFNRLQAWQNINILYKTVDSNQTINYQLLLNPSKRQYFSVDVEGSSLLNSSQLIQVGTGRVGLALNFTLRNRNIGRKAIQLENNLRTGIEFNNFERILSGEITLTNRLTFPWMVLPFKERLKWNTRSAKTVVSADLSFINRFQYFTLQSFNTFLGYEWRPKAGVTFQLRPINVEFTRFNPDSLFIESIKDFPLLLYTYNNGLILGSNVSYSKNFNPGRTRKINLLRLYAETSGLLAGAIFSNQTAEGKSLDNLYRFIKLDVDFRHIITYSKASLHFRLFAGYGFAFNTKNRTGDVTLPFFKSYFAGGPNSMRGWQIRKLGIGSNIFYDTVANGSFSDKYADVQLEGNVEYRFNMFQFFGFWMRGALFMDIGNIWYRKNLNGGLPRAELNLGRFYKDLAIAAGFGARIDFKYFLLRFDLGYPIKDPRYGPYNTGSPEAEQFYSEKTYGWFIKDVWNKPTLQFAIGYPF